MVYSYSLVAPPESKNITVGSNATFTCAAADPGKQLTITWSIDLHVGETIHVDNNITFQNGLQLATISFTATAQRNQTNVTCVISNDTTAVTAAALLLVQGTYTHEK